MVALLQYLGTDHHLVSAALEDMSDRLTNIFFGRWFVLFFFGAQGYWQVTGLLSNRSTGRVIETLCWIALSVLLIFIAWKVGWRKLRALGTKAQRRRRRLVVLASVPLTVAGVQLLVLTHDPYFWAIGTLFMLVPVVGLLYLLQRYATDAGVPQSFVPPAASD